MDSPVSTIVDLPAGYGLSEAGDVQTRRSRDALARSVMVSVVIPVFNESATLVDLEDRLRGVLQDPYEIIFIDDGSTDGSWNELVSLRRRGHVRLIRFRRNLGKTAALAAAFASVRGDLVITLDADLQDDPAELPRFVEKIREGWDVVSGWKRVRKDKLSKVIGSRIFNQLVTCLTGVHLHDVNCGFKAFRVEVVRSLRLRADMHRFLPVIAAANGFRVAEIVVEHHPRRHGYSKYGFGRIFKGLIDLVTVILITRFRDRPAHAFGSVALVCMLVSVICAVFQLAKTGALLFAIGAAAFFISAVGLMAVGWMGEILIEHVHCAAPGRRDASATWDVR